MYMGRLQDEHKVKLVKLLDREFSPYKVNNNFICYKVAGRLHLSSLMYVLQREGIALVPDVAYKIVRDNAVNNTRDNNIHKV
tara:strand:- start:568 stop:813 length:246 start_codon:yes stop_codon:yes gene_type:complete